MRVGIADRIINTLLTCNRWLASHEGNVLQIDMFEKFISGKQIDVFRFLAPFPLLPSSP